MTDFRAQNRAALANLLVCPNEDLAQRALESIHPDAVFDVSAPVEQLVGSNAILDGFIKPMRRALTGLHRRDEIFIGGHNIREEGGTWLASVVHYVGNFQAPLWGLEPSDKLVFLRAGEFYRLDDGKITKARIIVDLADLMNQAGRFPFPRELGTEITFPGPATHDGVCPGPSDGTRSLDVVEGMLAALHVYDPDTWESKDQTGTNGYWAEDMLWYGPGGIGSNYRWDGFVKDHRESFLRAFPDRKGGNHYCRIGDGNYAAVSGWPSMTMTHQGDYLGVPADGRALTLRVMDFYRCAGGKIKENWVLLDYVELMAQMGVDLIARSNAMTPLR
ncbi:MAG: ester cyclase [Pseudomonadota bacterium]